VTLLQTCRLLVVTADEQTVSDNDVTSSSDTMTTAGVIVIAVVICVVVTSLVWFIVIYKSRRHRSLTPFRSADVTACDAACHRTMSSVSDVDGSAQRLLAYGSSHTDFLHASMLSSQHCCHQCLNYIEARVCRVPHLFSLPHRAHAVAENLGTEGPHTYFSVIRLLVAIRITILCCNRNIMQIELVGHPLLAPSLLQGRGP